TRFSRDWSSDVCSSDLNCQKFIPTPFHFLGHGNGIGHSAFQRIVGIYQQHAVLGPFLCKMPKGGKFVLKTLDKGMCHGSGHRNRSEEHTSELQSRENLV